MTLPLVIMVDDNQSDLELGAMAFEENGARVEFVGMVNAEEASLRFEAMAADPSAKLPHLVILDLNMPRVGGHEILERLRSAPRLKDIPVVILTTSNAGADRAHSMAVGASEYQVKPHRLAAYLALFKTFEKYLPRDGDPPPATGATPPQPQSDQPAPGSSQGHQRSSLWRQLWPPARCAPVR